LQTTKEQTTSWSEKQLKVIWFLWLRFGVPPVTNLYFQFDTFEGPWNQGTASGTAGNFTGAASGLSLGTHILYAFATDGEEATSVMRASSPVIGGSTAYLFDELGISTSTTLTADLNPSIVTHQVTFTAAVFSTASGTPSGSVSFFDGGTFLANVALDNMGHAAYPTSSLTAGAHSIIAVYFPSPSAGFAASTSTAVSQSVLQTTSTALTSSANTVTTGQVVTFTATVSKAVGSTGTPTGTVTIRDGSTALGTGTLNASGVATFATSSLAAGLHPITAAYGGDSNFAASTSTALTETINAPLDFSIGVAPGGSTSATVKAGQAAMYSLQLFLVGGAATDQLMVTASCTGAPPKAMCSGPTSPVTVTQAAPPTVGISVTTTANALLIPGAPSPRLRIPWNHLPILWVPPTLLILLWLQRFRQTEARATAARPAFVASALLLAMLATAMGGCAGGGSTPTPPPANGTPAGTYTLTVTLVTPSNLTHAEQLTLIVK
jgi:hypothetical protein